MTFCLQDIAVELKDGFELRFGASTRSYFIKQALISRKRGVQWADADIPGA